MADAVTPSEAQKLTAVFPLLAEPHNYVASPWDLSEDNERRVYWLKLFRDHYAGLLDLALVDALDRGVARDVAESQVAQARAAFGAYLNHVEAEPRGFGRLTILTICEARERSLRRAGIPDPYRLDKERENETAMKLLPGVLEEIDALSGSDRIERVMRGVFAGNIFDLGAVDTVAMFKDGKMDFHHTLGKLKPRPWFVDHLDAWRDRWLNGPAYRCAVVFVDNAGPDVLLGMVPFTRELLRTGIGVILTANATPTLNDVTHEELTVLIDRIAGLDAIIGNALKSAQLELITSGNGAPLIDLRYVNPALADAIYRRDADLCVIEGMGRSIETNFDAEFNCDALKLAMIKDLGVAEAMGAGLYDLVLRFDRIED
jgi:type II pantothenate kinase